MQVQDAAQRYFMAYLGTTHRSLSDLEIEFLSQNGFPTGQIDERWRGFAEANSIPEPYKYNSFLTRDYVVENSLGFSDEALALFARMDVQPTVERKVLYNVFINSLKSSGVWVKLDVLYLFAAHDAQSARLNLIKDAHNLTAVSSPTFTVDRGYTTGGTSYLNTNYAPKPDAVTVTKDNAHISIWERTNVGTGVSFHMGSRDAGSVNEFWIWPRTGSNTVGGRISSQGSFYQSAEANTTTIGDTIFQRLPAPAGTVNAYRNGSTPFTFNAVAVSDLSSTPVIIGGFSTDGVVTVSAIEASIASIGASLSSEEVLTFYNAKLTYLQSVGAV